MASTKSVASDDEAIHNVKTKRPRREKPSFGGIIKLKKPPPKHNKPGNWLDGSILDEGRKKRVDELDQQTASLEPVVNQLDDAAWETFPTGRPLVDSPDLTRCTICKKMILKSVSAIHVTACNKLKKEKAQRKKEQKEARERERREAEGAGEEEDEEEDADDKTGNGIKSIKKSAGKKVDPTDERKSKKRKAETDAEKGPRLKKKKDEPKPKHPKQKGPVDVERQCGVIKDGVPCARSLTCKSHSMGAKRAVAGRSLPYDFLLAAYQKKNQAKQQKAAIDANAPLEDEDPTLGPIDSDEELSAVMHGFSNWNPRPAVPPLVQIPIDRKYMRERLREQLSQATNGFTLNIFKVKAPVDEIEFKTEESSGAGNIATSRKPSLSAEGLVSTD
ncbi:unnamed protein product [Blumeria hordei]|uniref:SCA7 domain-containing protein n=1 Tax=Blumeria hordei TaxID=2867405 RepID=A0A383V2A9_BLUHO|nr:unnamed protein product [Blumeria hordei]